MPSRRAEVAMSMNEICAYLRAAYRLILVSNGHDGFPHPMPMNFLFDDDQYLITTFRKSQKVRNLERDPRVSLLVESGRAYHELKSVIACAEAEIVDDLDMVYRVMDGLARKESGGQAARTQEIIASSRVTAPKRVVIRFRPLRYLSWDHSKLQGTY